MTTLRRAAGQLLVVGVGGTELTGLERAWLKLVQPAGIILFKRNIADVQQTRALLSGATKLCAANPLRCVDVEGGTVDRLRDALAPLPSAQAVARACVPRLSREHGELVARGVKAFGLNATLAPVLDLALPQSATVMGSRVAADTAAGVVSYAREFLAGLATQHIVGCGKHFPGLGGGTLDSHVATPEIEREWEQLWRDDMEPYRLLRRELPMIMVNHAAYPATRGGKKPASVSPFWIETVLRRQIGYRGLIFSDDMEMGGILKFMSIEEAAIAAVCAGMDLIEICHSAELILRAHEALIAEAERSAAFAQRLLARERTTARKRSKLFSDAMGRAPASSQLDALRKRISRFAETIASAPQGQPA